MAWRALAGRLWLSRLTVEAAGLSFKWQSGCREGTAAPADSGLRFWKRSHRISIAIGGHYGQSATSLTTSGVAPLKNMPDIFQKMQRTWPSKSSTSHTARVAREVPMYREIIARAGMKKL
jgi:hypothetical protein